MKKLLIGAFVALAVVLISSGFVIAGITPNHTHKSAADIVEHGGGLDSNGCHHDRQNGGYHCH